MIASKIVAMPSMAALSTGWVAEINIVMPTATNTMNIFLAESLKGLDASHARAMATTLTITIA